MLSGTEVKSVRMGKVNIRDSYAKIENGEAVVHDLHISSYEKGNIFNKDPLRPRKLLLHKREISKLAGYISREGFTIVPTKVYFKSGLVKIEIAVAKGKKLFDKREAIAEKTLRRETERDFKVRNLY